MDVSRKSGEGQVTMIPLTTFDVVAVLLVVLFYLYLLYRRRRNVKPKPASIMQPARADLDPPKDDVFTVEQLRAFDGSREGFPLLVSIKGTVFDVSRKKDVYGPGALLPIYRIYCEAYKVCLQAKVTASSLAEMLAKPLG